MRQFLLLVLITELAFSGISISGGPVYFVSHSENNEPSLLVTPYEYGWNANFEYRYGFAPHKMLHVVLGFSEISSAYENRIVSAVGISEIHENAGSFRERSIPLIFRYFTSANGITGYGAGPLISVTEHLFNYIPLNPDERSLYSLEETIYSTGLGISSLLRFGTPFSKHFFSHVDLEFLGIQAIHFRGSGQDLSDYVHNTFQVKLSFGFGNR